MKLLQINSVYFHGSTGKIVYRIHQAAKERGIDSYVIYSRNGALAMHIRRLRVILMFFKLQIV